MISEGFTERLFTDHWLAHSPSFSEVIINAVRPRNNPSPSPLTYDEFQAILGSITGNVAAAYDKTLFDMLTRASSPQLFANKPVTFQFAVKPPKESFYPNFPTKPSPKGAIIQHTAIDEWDRITEEAAKNLIAPNPRPLAEIFEQEAIASVTKANPTATSIARKIFRKNNRQK